MRFTVVLLVTLVVAATSGSATEFEQTDWSGGGDQTGPVPQWSDRFAEADQVSWRAVPGQLALSSDYIASPTRHLINDAYLEAFDIDAADMDGDGDVDVVCTAAASGIVTIFWNDGTDPMSWTERVIDTNFPGASGVFIEDIDSDGHLDVVVCAAAPWHQIAWWRNSGGDPVAWTRQTIATNWQSAYEVFAADVDLDGHVDVLSTTWHNGQVAWWRNDGESPIGWTQMMVTESFAGAHSVRTADFDGDGDQDLVAAGGECHEIAWWRNDDGSATSWTKHLIRADFDGARSVRAADMDDDGLIDVIATCWTRHVAWWRNEGGDPLSWREQIIENDFDGGHCVEIADINGDGRLDVLGAAYLDHSVAWWENSGGSPITWNRRPAGNPYANPINAGYGDVDGDGALEVLGVSHYLGEFCWWDVCGFRSDGALTSAILDCGDQTPTTLGWTASVPETCDLRWQVRRSNDPADLGDWSADMTTPGTIPGEPGRYLQYRVLMHSGTPSRSPVVFVVVVSDDLTGVGQTFPDSPQDRVRAWPNPCNPGVNVAFELPVARPVRVMVFDVQGRPVATLANRQLSAGSHSLRWDGCDDRGATMPSGVYLVRVMTQNTDQAAKILMVR